MITDTLKKSTEPVTRFNKLLMDTVSRVGEMQMASIKDYMSMAGDQARQATQIRDYEDLQKYLSNQAETFSTIMEKANDDLQEMQRMAEEFRQEATEVFQSATAVNDDDQSEQSSEAAPKPAKAASSKSQTKSSGSGSKAAS